MLSSASSSLGMKLPLTPQDDVLSEMMMTRKQSKMSYNKDKHLPPLPIQSILKQQPGRIGMGGAGTVPIPKTSARSRAGSINSADMMSTPTTPKPMAMMKPTNVRPLHLPQKIASTSDMPPVPVPVLCQVEDSGDTECAYNGYRSGVLKVSLKPFYVLYLFY
jgi:hypothetical protein